MVTKSRDKYEDQGGRKGFIRFNRTTSSCTMRSAKDMSWVIDRIILKALLHIPRILAMLTVAHTSLNETQRYQKLRGLYTVGKGLKN